MRRFVIAAACGLLALLVLAMPAVAGRTWCARDPIVRIGGTDVQIWVAIPTEYEPFVKEKVEVKIKAPKRYPRQVLFTDQGFNGKGEEVKWGDLNDPGDGTIPLEVEVKVVIDKGRFEKVFGKDVPVPVLVTVNVGEITREFTFETNNHTKFTTDITATAEVD